MQKMILFIIILINTMSINAILEDPHWFDIVNYITENSEKNNRNEFEAAKQAFLNIKVDDTANRASRLISRKWKANFPEADANALKALKRYPNMTAADVKAAGEKLFKDHEGFINGTGEGQLNMGCRIP
mgnify:CR=1 FL=1